MIRSASLVVGLFSFALVQIAIGCDIIVRVKSVTKTPFRAQVIPPKGNSSQKEVLKKNERLVFHEKASECGLGQFQIKTFSKGPDGKFTKEEHNVKVSLNGIGSVNYEVGDNLLPKQTTRQGAQCEGQCAPLAVTIPPTRKTSAKATTTKP